MRKQNSVPLMCRSVAIPAFLLAVFGCVVFHTSPSMAEDLQTAYKQAASTSPMIAQARAQLDADLAGKPLARAALLPHINAGASGGMNTGRVAGFGAQTISTGYHSDVFSASLTESIFNGQAFTAMKQSDSRIRASEAALAYAQQVVALQVTQAYFGILQAEANQRVAQQQMGLLESIDKQTRASLQVGSGDIISMQEAQAQLDAAKADLLIRP
jgi:outer membrane protein